jgi:hypothetical protein
MDAQSQAILVMAVALVLGWFAIGMTRNIRRGNAVLRWMQGGLPRIGEKTKLRWLGSSAVELSIDKAKSPFRKVDLLIVLEARDVPWFWLLGRLHRRRDMLIVRGQLTSAPRFEFDVFAPNSWSEQQASHTDAAQWEPESLDGANFSAPAPTRSLSRPIALTLLTSARRVWPVVWRLSSRREFPQLELQVPLPDTNRADATQFFEGLCDVAEKFNSR